MKKKFRRQKEGTKVREYVTKFSVKYTDKTTTTTKATTATTVAATTAATATTATATTTAKTTAAATTTAAAAAAATTTHPNEFASTLLEAEEPRRLKRFNNQIVVNIISQIC